MDETSVPMDPLISEHIAWDIETEPFEIEPNNILKNSVPHLMLNIIPLYYGEQPLSDALYFKDHTKYTVLAKYRLF
jgi:hypothetical protein